MLYTYIFFFIPFLPLSCGTSCRDSSPWIARWLAGRTQRPPVTGDAWWTLVGWLLRGLGEAEREYEDWPFELSVFLVGFDSGQGVLVAGGHGSRSMYGVLWLNVWWMTVRAMMMKTVVVGRGGLWGIRSVCVVEIRLCGGGGGGGRFQIELGWSLSGSNGGGLWMVGSTWRSRQGGWELSRDLMYCGEKFYVCLSVFVVLFCV